MLEEQRMQCSFQDCVVYARELFQRLFVNGPLQLLHAYPATHMEQGLPFYSKHLCPRPVAFNGGNAHHVTFVVAATYLRAYSLGLLASEVCMCVVWCFCPVSVCMFLCR
jgi:hypothetical protein